LFLTLGIFTSEGSKELKEKNNNNTVLCVRDMNWHLRSCQWSSAIILCHYSIGKYCCSFLGRYWDQLPAVHTGCLSVCTHLVRRVCWWSALPN